MFLRIEIILYSNFSYFSFKGHQVTILSFCSFFCFGGEQGALFLFVSDSFFLKTTALKVNIGSSKG